MLYRIQIISFLYCLNAVVIKTEHICTRPRFTNHFDCKNLTSLEEVNLRFETGLDSMSVWNSKITQIPSHAMNSRFPGLRHLHLTGQGVEEIASEAFSGLPDLDTLYLDHNSITALPSHSLNPKLVTVIFSNNKISSIDPEAFASADQLSQLNLNDNQLESLSSGLFKDCRNLKQLNVSNNQIKVIDEKIFEGAENLITLDFENNQITDIPPETFAKLKNLNYVNLNNNHLTVVRNSWFSTLTNLSYFYAAHNKIKSVEPSSFQNALKLSTVDLSHNEVSHIYRTWFSSLKNLNDFSSLFEIDLSYNEFSKLSNEDKEVLCYFPKVQLNHNQLNDEDVDSLIMQCSNVEILYMEGNNIKNLKIESLENSSLIQLAFSYNDIEEFDYSIFLKSKYLDVSLGHNKIKKLPENVPGEIKIHTLLLEHNKIQTIEENAFKNFTRLRYLNMGYNEISAVSPGAFNSLTESSGLNSSEFETYTLDLFFNKINSFENWFIEGSNAILVNVSHNHIKKIGINSLKGAGRLYTLDISYNEISELSPISCKNTPYLSYVSLEHNNLTVLSENSIADCSELLLLDFSFNNIKTIYPNALKNLPELKLLNLKNNHLTVLADSVLVGTRSLEYLNISSNEIENISSHVFSKNEHFSFFLDASHNKLRNISREIFSKPSPNGTFMFNFAYNKIDNKDIETFLQHFVKDSGILKVSLQDNFIEDKRCEVSNGTPQNDVCVIKICKDNKCDYDYLDNLGYIHYM